jgi:hypothetical protein
MLVACRLAGLSALGAHSAGVKRRAQRDDAACGWVAQRDRLVQMAQKIRRLARNSKLCDDDNAISLPRSHRRVRVGL